jgi:hypothetical protein
MNQGPSRYFLMKKNRGGKSRATVPLTTKYSKIFQRSFVIGWKIVLSFEGLWNSYTRTYTEFRGISQYDVKYRQFLFRTNEAGIVMSS